MSKVERLLLHPQTSQQIDLFLAKPHHFLLLVGPSGLGKFTIGRLISSRLLNLDSNQTLSKYPFFHYIARPDNRREISIDQIRDLIANLRLKTTGQGTLRRIILVKNAHQLSEEAQNALLKTLEEPPADSLFIFTVDSLSNLLPTIVSRARIINLQPSTLSATKDFYKDRFDLQKIEQAWQLGSGRPGLIYALLNGNQEHGLKQAIDQAKLFLSETKYQRLIDKNGLSQNREKLRLFLDALHIIVQTLQRVAIDKQKNVSQIKFVKTSQLISQLKIALDANVGSRLIYLALCLKLEL